jgi:hypothetical protein
MARLKASLFLSPKCSHGVMSISVSSASATLRVSFVSVRAESLTDWSIDGGEIVLVQLLGCSLRVHCNC